MKRNKLTMNDIFTTSYTDVKLFKEAKKIIFEKDEYFKKYNSEATHILISKDLVTHLKNNFTDMVTEKDGKVYVSNMEVCYNSTDDMIRVFNTEYF